jgi:hypothetical protein
MRGYQPLMATDVACCLAALSLTVLQHFRFLRPGLRQNGCHQENNDKSMVCVIGVTDALLNALRKKADSLPTYWDSSLRSDYKLQITKFQISDRFRSKSVIWNLAFGIANAGLETRNK